jgi:hypothetical protein
VPVSAPTFTVWFSLSFTSTRTYTLSHHCRAEGYKSPHKKKLKPRDFDDYMKVIFKKLNEQLNYCMVNN